jgi:glucosamine kinase
MHDAERAQQGCAPTIGFGRRSCSSHRNTKRLPLRSFVFFVFFVVNPSFKIGADGGGTKTELILVDAGGRIVARHTAPGCNPSQTGTEKARVVLGEAIEALLAQSKISNPKSKISTTLLCMAGSPAFWQKTAAALTSCGKVVTGSDALPVLELATNGAPGLVLHAGTGSFIAARAADGSVHYAGGLGWKLGDPGSGFDLGRRAIAHALLELQGWAEVTPLSRALQTHLDLVDAGTITHFLYADAAANAAIAGFARRVIELAAQGCAPAQAALAATLHEFVGQARLVTGKLFAGARQIPCGVSSAILNSPPASAALRSLAEVHAWPVEYRFITEPPIEGVRRLLAKM